MKKNIVSGVTVFLVMVIWIFNSPALNAQEQEQEETKLPISWENWRQARVGAEKYDAEGDYTRALQYYLEYIRQAEGLGRMDIVAWGKNNAAYMIIKQHKQDPSTDLAPAKKLLEEGLAISEATEECRLKLQSNLEYVKMFIKD
ncbi:MAG: hypothetical protein QME28_09295 [Candidatus Saccharicenans sp.]|nr:hypothetical protein [Candidatus Saccharicenans sp.]